MKFNNNNHKNVRYRDHTKKFRKYGAKNKILNLTLYLEDKMYLYVSIVLIFRIIPQYAIIILQCLDLKCTISIVVDDAFGFNAKTYLCTCYIH